MTESEPVFAGIIDNCAECGSCRTGCAYLTRYGTPKALAGKFLSSFESDPVFPFECSLCGLCSSVCPKGLEPWKLFLSMRRILTALGGGIRPGHSAILRFERMGISRLFTFYALPEGCRTVFFTGCALPGSRPDKTYKAFTRLREIVPALGIVLDCCTKPSHDLGRHDRFLALFGEMKNYLLEHGITTVLTACPSCHHVFTEYGGSLEVRSVYEVLDGAWEGRGELSGAVVSVHDSCVGRFDVRVQSAVRSLLSKTGCRLDEMPHSGKNACCCGEGGAVAAVSPELAARWTEMRRAEATGKKLVTCCAGCSAVLGKTMPAAHILDYLFEPQAALAGRSRASRSPMTWWNRIWLKAALRRMVGPALTGTRTASKIQ